MHAHLERLGIELHGDAYIFHNRSGAPYSSDTLGDDFRAVRLAAFGEHDKCTLSASNTLFATYCPVNLTTIRSVMEARRRGRAKLRGNE